MTETRDGRWKLTKAPLTEDTAHWELTDEQTGQVVWDGLSDEPAEAVFRRIINHLGRLTP